jgi:hypothetical protein
VAHSVVLAALVLTSPQRAGRIRSAERTEVHLLSDNSRFTN